MSRTMRKTGGLSARGHIPGVPPHKIPFVLMLYHCKLSKHVFQKQVFHQRDIPIPVEPAPSCLAPAGLIAPRPTRAHPHPLSPLFGATLSSPPSIPSR